MPLNDTALNAMGAVLDSSITALSLHSATPNATGSNETTAGRQTPSFSVANGDVTMDAAEAFTGGAANGAVAAVGLWAGAVWWGYFPITGDASFNSSGEYTLDTLVIAGS